MSRLIFFRQAARREFDEAADWYQQRLDGLGARFVTAVEHVLDQATASPERFPEVQKGIRQGLVQGFPYCVYFEEERERIVVLAIFHASQDPQVWQSRV